MTFSTIILELEKNGYYPDELAEVKKTDEGIVFCLTNGDKILVNVNPKKKSRSKGTKIIKTSEGDEICVQIL